MATSGHVDDQFQHEVCFPQFDAQGEVHQVYSLQNQWADLRSSWDFLWMVQLSASLHKIHEVFGLLSLRFLIYKN